MMTQIDFSSEMTEKLELFLEKNKGIDFRLFNLMEEQSINSLCWGDFSNEKETILPLVRGYQRLIRIIPKGKDAAAIGLLSLGLHSALQIAAMTRKEHMEKVSSLFTDEPDLSDTIYSRALDKREILLIQHLDVLQNNEPHISAARFN